MKQIFTFLMISLALFGCSSGASDKTDVEGQNASLEIPKLLERTGPLAMAVEWPKTKMKVDELMNVIANKPNEVKPRLQLATIYIAEARITGEHPYYYPAIDKILDGVLRLEPQNYEGNILKASVKMSQHHFAEGKQWAEKAMAINPSNAYTYGILVDANVELGDYEAAIAASDKMQSLKPSLESYSRASYLREIYGDFKGAKEAMQLAVEAGLPGSEPQSWSGNALGDLYVKTNDLDKAELEYRKVISLRPTYAFAWAGLAKVQQKKKNYEEALRYLDSATTMLPEFSFHEQMGDIYALQGNNEMAQKKFAEVKNMLSEDANSGHLVGLEMAKLFVKMNQLDSAKKYAMEEYAARPNNIDVNKELAWISYKQNQKDKAIGYMKTATRTGSKDPELKEREGAIMKMAS